MILPGYLIISFFFAVVAYFHHAENVHAGGELEEAGSARKSSLEFYVYIETWGSVCGQENNFHLPKNGSV